MPLYTLLVIFFFQMMLLTGLKIVLANLPLIHKPCLVCVSKILVTIQFRLCFLAQLELYGTLKVKDTSTFSLLTPLLIR